MPKVKWRACSRFCTNPAGTQRWNSVDWTLIDVVSTLCTRLDPAKTLRLDVWGAAFYHNDLSHSLRKKYLLTCEPNVDSDQTAHTRSLIRVFVVRMKKLCILNYPKCAKWKLWSDWANAQVDLNLRWAHMSEGTFTDVAVYFLTKPLKYLPFTETRFFFFFFFFFFFGNPLSSLKVQLCSFHLVFVGYTGILDCQENF